MMLPPPRQSTSPVYYDVNELPRDGYPILLLLPSGQEVVALRYTDTRRNRHLVRWVMRVWDETTRKEVKVDLPRKVTPTRWRPISLAKFPYQLPKPAPVMAEVAWQSPPEPEAIPEVPDDLDWRGPYHRAPDISPEEVRIRVLRALRTVSAKGEKGATSDGGSIGPHAYVDSVMLVARGVILAEYFDTTKLEAVALPWEPTRRDRDDMLIALSWYCRLTKKQQDVIRKRSYLPPWSFRQIGDAMKGGEGVMTADGARKVYVRALESVTFWANTK